MGIQPGILSLLLLLLFGASVVETGETSTNVIYDGSSVTTYVGGLPDLPQGTNMIEYGPATLDRFDG